MPQQMGGQGSGTGVGGGSGVGGTGSGASGGGGAGSSSTGPGGSTSGSSAGVGGGGVGGAGASGAGADKSSAGTPLSSASAGAGGGGGMTTHYGSHSQGARQAQGMYGTGQGSVPGQVRNSESIAWCKHTGSGASEVSRYWRTVIIKPSSVDMQHLVPG